MGYLNQKKRKERENIFFVAVSILMVSVSFLLLLNSEFTILHLNLFHFYCLGCVLFIGAICAKKILPMVVLGGSLLVVYVLLAISGNIFFSDKVAGKYEAKIEFNDSLEIRGALSKGVLVSGQKMIASYAMINEEAPLMVIMVDFRGISRNKYEPLLKNLHRFIMKQDTEVVLLGNFGMPAWSKTFRKFVEASGLTVKNRFIFDGIFSVPKFYVLGYKGVGIKDINRKDGKLSVYISYDIL